MPRQLKVGQLWKLLGGYVLAVVMAFVSAVGLRSVGGTIAEFAAMVLIAAGFAIMAARLHRNFLFAVLGPAVGAAVGAPVCAAVVEYSQPEEAIARWIVVVFLSVAVGVMTWIPACLAGIVTVRLIRGRWNWPAALKCPVCGYDLQGLHVPICPECGADCRAFV